MGQKRAQNFNKRLHFTYFAILSVAFIAAYILVWIVTTLIYNTSYCLGLYLPFYYPSFKL